ncbi:hypothetical protein D3C85_952560 [compost metagenome]
MSTPLLSGPSTPVRSPAWVPSRLVHCTMAWLSKSDSAAAVALTTPDTRRTMLPPLTMSMLAPLTVRNWPPTISKSTPPLLVAPFW